MQDSTPLSIRLLIVDANPETVQTVQKLLHFERDIQVIDVASTGREAIARPRRCTLMSCS
jgi:DNA-binding NarL/FixJ family response regulator